MQIGTKESSQIPTSPAEGTAIGKATSCSLTDTHLPGLGWQPAEERGELLGEEDLADSGEHGARWNQ